MMQRPSSAPCVRRAKDISEPEVMCGALRARWFHPEREQRSIPSWWARREQESVCQSLARVAGTITVKSERELPSRRPLRGNWRRPHAGAMNRCGSDVADHTNICQRVDDEVKATATKADLPPVTGSSCSTTSVPAGASAAKVDSMRILAHDFQEDARRLRMRSIGTERPEPPPPPSLETLTKMFLPLNLPNLAMHGDAVTSSCTGVAEHVQRHPPGGVDRTEVMAGSQNTKVGPAALECSSDAKSIFSNNESVGLNHGRPPSPPNHGGSVADIDKSPTSHACPKQKREVSQANVEALPNQQDADDARRHAKIAEPSAKTCALGGRDSEQGKVEIPQAAELHDTKSHPNSVAPVEGARTFPAPPPPPPPPPPHVPVAEVQPDSGSSNVRFRALDVLAGLPGFWERADAKVSANVSAQDDKVSECLSDELGSQDDFTALFEASFASPEKTRPGAASACASTDAEGAGSKESIYNGVMVVDKVSDGDLLSAWNISHPDCQVRPGDRVLAVNGEVANAKTLMQIIKQEETLEMRISRVLQDTTMPAEIAGAAVAAIKPKAHAEVELRERALCPICMLVLPADERKQCHKSCCGTMQCKRCVDQAGQVCAFCREAGPSCAAEIVARLESRITLGDAVAMVIVATHCLDGTAEWEEDSARAVELFRQAAALGNVAAAFNLGHLYETGESVQQDDDVAMSWYELAAKREHAQAMIQLGADNDGAYPFQATPLHGHGSPLQANEPIANAHVLPGDSILSITQSLNSTMATYAAQSDCLIALLDSSAAHHDISQTSLSNLTAAAAEDTLNISKTLSNIAEVTVFQESPRSRGAHSPSNHMNCDSLSPEHPVHATDVLDTTRSPPKCDDQYATPMDITLPEGIHVTAEALDITQTPSALLHRDPAVSEDAEVILERTQSLEVVNQDTTQVEHVPPAVKEAKTQLLDTTQTPSTLQHRDTSADLRSHVDVVSAEDTTKTPSNHIHEDGNRLGLVLSEEQGDADEILDASQEIIDASSFKHQDSIELSQASTTVVTVEARELRVRDGFLEIGFKLSCNDTPHHGYESDRCSASMSTPGGMSRKSGFESISRYGQSGPDGNSARLSHLQDEVGSAPMETDSRSSSPAHFQRHSPTSHASLCSRVGAPVTMKSSESFSTLAHIEVESPHWHHASAQMQRYSPANSSHASLYSGAAVHVQSVPQVKAVEPDAVDCAPVVFSSPESPPAKNASRLCSPTPMQKYPPAHTSPGSVCAGAASATSNSPQHALSPIMNDSHDRPSPQLQRHSPARTSPESTYSGTVLQVQNGSQVVSLDSPESTLRRTEIDSQSCLSAQSQRFPFADTSSAEYVETFRSAMNSEPSFVEAQSLLAEHLRGLEEQLQASKSECVLHRDASLRTQAELDAMRQERSLAELHTPLQSNQVAYAATTAAIAGTAAAAAASSLQGRMRSLDDQLQASKSECAFHRNASQSTKAELEALRQQRSIALPSQAAYSAASAAIAGTAAAAAVAALGRQRAAQGLDIPAPDIA